MKIVVVVAVVATTRVAMAGALDKPAFTATPAELLAAASDATGNNEPAIVLRDDTSVVLDERGRQTRRERLVYVVRSQAGVDAWGTIDEQWSPFYQDTPAIRARVIEPSGKVVELDAKLISSAPLVSSSPTVFSDRRRIQAPLPRLSLGAIVEREVVTVDREPVLAAGSVSYFGFGQSVPTRSTRATITAPASRKLHFVPHNLPAGLKPQHATANGRQTWTYAVEALPARGRGEELSPSDVWSSAYVVIGTAGSWNAVARDYRKLVEKRISDGPFALPAELPRTPTLETARAIVAWLHRTVRYTGIDLGDASNVPWPPAETVKRGSGDCNDKATLLVALLRQAGMQADLALLHSGPGVDLDRDAPGMGAFDHAIVRAKIAGRDVWIDATEDLVAVGALPSRDQKRYALVVADATTVLVATPASTPAINTVREVRTYELDEAGRARVTEVARMTGAPEVEARSYVRDTPADAVKKQLTRYVEAEYSATYASHGSTPPADLAVPFEVRVVGTNARRTGTGRDSTITLALSPAAVLRNVPRYLRHELAEPRRADLEWYIPHVYEIEHRIVIPDGFTMPTPAPKGERTLGTTTLVERQRVDGKTFVVTYRFDSGKPRLTAAEVTSTVAAFRELAGVHSKIVIEHAGLALVANGKPREGLAEIERSIKVHPTEAVHRMQLALAYLEVGMGVAARRAARRGVELEPRNADAHAVLGWILRHDTIGREYGFDHDRAGALAAYAKARQLDPKHVGAAADHASLLERDAHGGRFESGVNLELAAAAWQEAYTLDPSDAHALGLLHTLIRTGKLAEAEKLARKTGESGERNMLLVAVVALTRGAGPAVTAARKLATGAASNAILEGAVATLALMREYDVARALIGRRTKPAKGSFAALAGMLPKLARMDAPLVAANPKTPVFESTSLGLAMWQQPQVFWDAEVEKDVRGSLPSMGNNVTTRAFLRDTLATVDWKVEGASSGPWHVSATIGNATEIYYVALDRGVAKLLGTPAVYAGIGRYALQLLGKKDVTAARAVLKWFRSDIAHQGFNLVWDAPHDADTLPLAAAFAAIGTEPAAIPILERCATKVAAAKLTCDAFLVATLVKLERNKEAEVVMARIQQRDPDSPLIEARAELLVKLKRFDEAEQLAAARLAKVPGEQWPHEIRARTAQVRGKPRDALPHFSRSNRLQAQNNAAWARLLEHHELDVALTIARKAVGADLDATPPNILHTLAAIEAETGELLAAKQHAWKLMERGRRSVPDPGDWYVFGRIADQLGQRADAIAAYRRVPRPSVDDGVGQTWHLAQARLKVLQP